MNLGHRLSEDEARHRLLEGFLLRLARLPHPEDFVLRGGMLLRHWFRPLERRAKDLDLVSRKAFSVEATAKVLVPLLADRSVDDGVTFDASRHRVEGIWMNTPHPGFRLYACGEVQGVKDEFTVDVTFGEPLVPEPVPGLYGPMACGQAPRLWMCRPETIVGRKLHALMRAGVQHWRPKDLYDVLLLMQRVPMNLEDLPEAIAVSFTSRGNTTADARSLFAPQSWWLMKMALARWHDFAEDTSGQEIPRDLARVVAQVAEQLNPISERMP